MQVLSCVIEDSGLLRYYAAMSVEWSSAMKECIPKGQMYQGFIVGINRRGLTSELWDGKWFNAHGPFQDHTHILCIPLSCLVDAIWCPCSPATSSFYFFTSPLPKLGYFKGTKIIYNGVFFFLLGLSLCRGWPWHSIATDVCGCAAVCDPLWGGNCWPYSILPLFLSSLPHSIVLNTVVPQLVTNWWSDNTSHYSPS